MKPSVSRRSNRKVTKKVSWIWYSLETWPPYTSHIHVHTCVHLHRSVVDSTSIGSTQGCTHFVCTLCRHLLGFVWITTDAPEFDSYWRVCHDATALKLHYRCSSGSIRKPKPVSSAWAKWTAWASWFGPESIRSKWTGAVVSLKIEQIILNLSYHDVNFFFPKMS